MVWVTEYTPLGLPNFLFKDTLLRYNAGFLSARIGEWLFTVALNWVVFVQTESALLLAAINTCRLLPNLIFSIPAGQMADRFDRQKLNTLANGLNTLFILAIGLSLWLQLPFGVCAALVFLRAVVTAAEGPFRNALLCSIFEGQRLKQAVAQNASVMNLGRIVGPVLGGVMLASTGSMTTFLAAAFTTAAYSWILNSLPPLQEHQEPSPSKKSEAKFSFRETLKEFPQLRKLIFLAVPVMFFGFPFTAMLPLVTDSMLGLGSEEFGSLLAVSAAGALLASSQLSMRPCASNWNYTRLYAGLFGISLVGLSQVKGFLSAAVVLFAVGFFGQAYRTSSRMLFQDIVPREKAGRMMGLALMDRGLIPLGVMLVGLVAEQFDPRSAVFMMGFGCLVSVGLLFPPKTLGQKIIRPSALLSVFAFIFLTGCQSGNAPNPIAIQGPSTKVEHAWGATDVPIKPQRIVVLDLPFLDSLTALQQPVVGFAGTSEKTVPVYLQDQIPGETPLFVGERKQPNLEVILSLEPDLIVANPDRHKMIRSQLETIAPTIALTDDSLEDIVSMTELFAIITDKKEQGRALTESLQNSLSSTREIQDGQPTVLVVGAFEDEFSTWTQGSFIGSLFKSVGANYLFKGAPSASESQTEVAKITVEGLADLDPDFLFVYGDPKRWNDHPLYTQLTAFKEDRVLHIDRDLWSRARGPIAAQKILEMYADFLKQSQGVALQSTGQ